MKLKLKDLIAIERRLEIYGRKKPDWLLEEIALYSSSLHDYFKGMWHVIEGKASFVDGWHIGALSEHLEAVYTGDIKRLIINVPPRTSKSSLISIAFPTWTWVNDPARKFLYISYGARLAQEHSVRSRNVIESNWYQERWGDRFRLSQDMNTKQKFENDKTGARIATSVHGTATGLGGDVIIFDDPNSAADALSDAKREGTNLWCDNVASTRLNDPKTGAIVIVQQRVHAHDYTGHLLGQEDSDYVNLCLPMEFEISRKCITVPLKSTKGMKWQDPRTEENEILWPDRFSRAELEDLKRRMGSSYVVAGQLQQRPSPEEGGIIKKDWFRWYNDREMPRCSFILQSWDTALSTGPTACYSACTTWGIFKDEHGVDNIILLSTWRGRVEYPDLKRMAIRLSRCIFDTYTDNPVPEDYVYKPHMILIEAKANGLSLIQDLNRAGLIITKFDPRGSGDKVQRARIANSLIEGGRVWLPARAPDFTRLRPFAEEFLMAAAMFPNDESNDYIDSMSQAFIKMRDSGAIGHPDDAVFETRIKDNRPLY